MSQERTISKDGIMIKTNLRAIGLVKKVTNPLEGASTSVPLIDLVTEAYKEPATKIIARITENVNKTKVKLLTVN